MLVTPEINRRNRVYAVILVGIIAAATFLAAWFWLPALLFLCVCPLIFRLVRRRCARRLRIMNQPFPAFREQVLESRVAFFRALTAAEKERFRQIVKVFLDEVRITGIGTEINDTVRVLVAASAAIPIFGFRDWEYHRLGEVLIYPDSFGKDYKKSKRQDADILGMTGLNQLRGVMIISKPSLLAGFETRSGGSENVGIHEFAHLVKIEEIETGLPPEVPWQAVKHWFNYVSRELSDPTNPASIRGYAYTNEQEFFAVLAEYFFKSPDLLKEKKPELYRMLRKMFHQDTAALFKRALSRRAKYGRNLPCPCGSGEKYKNCCLLKTDKSKSANKASEMQPAENRGDVSNS